jgi:peptidase E
VKRREFLKSSALGAGAVLSGAGAAPTRAAETAAGSSFATTQASRRKILIAGGGFNTAFIRYMAQLTGKPRPKLLYLPTASADSPSGIITWFRNCAPLDVEASAQESFIASTRQTRSWEEVFLSVDGIVCSGGNTLNQQAIWKAQGIDVILKQAWDRGIVLGGASAGSLCWFEEGTTDSRPKELTIVQCLGFLAGSHSPHYDAEKDRRPLYHKLIGSGQMKPGWACDNDAGIYLEDNEPKRFVHTRDAARVYHVSVAGGKVVEKPYSPEKIS